MAQKTQKKFDAEEVIKEFEKLSKEAGKVQEETLKKILEENGDTVYLKKWGLNGRTDSETFKACVPIVTHKDIEPYIQRIADGDHSPVLTREPVTALSLSSGTTEGRQKFIPFNETSMKNTMQTFQTSFAFRNREFPIGNGKALQFIYSSKQFKTKGGLSAGTATTNVYSNAQFKKTMQAIQTPCCSPDEVIFSSNSNEALYCHLLCGLIFLDEIQTISSTFAHSIVSAFRTFEQVWEELVADIRHGTLSSRVTVTSLRAEMLTLLKPNPKLAETIYSKCSGLNNWYGLIPALFPNVSYIYGIMTGSMEPYLKKLRHYAGDLHLVSADYGSSEGWIGVNVNSSLPPEEVTFAVIPNVGYFEFIPFRESIDGLEPRAVGLSQVKLGEEYEIVLTNCKGLYRYRLGDIVKIKGFHNATPEVQFSCRRGVLLSINTDKNTEKDLQLAVETAARLLIDENVELVDFTSHVKVTTYPGHYVVFWEINGEASDATLQECCNRMDKSFIDIGYIGPRKADTIGPLELRVLKRGTFDKILDHFVGMGGAGSQFKTPRYVCPNNSAVLQILCSGVVKSYSSTALF